MENEKMSIINFRDFQVDLSMTCSVRPSVTNDILRVKLLESLTDAGFTVHNISVRLLDDLS